MSRYNPNREANILERALGGLLALLVGLNVLAGIVAGARWLWHYLGL